MGLLDLMTGQQRFGASGMAGVEGQALDATQRERLAGNDALANLYRSAPGELESLFGAELRGRGMDYGIQEGGIQRADQQEQARRDRKQRYITGAVSGGTSLATGGLFGGGKPAKLPFSNNNSYYAGRP
jgi:hypothetical protein